MDKLWLYNLHYFDDLNAEGSADREAWHRTLIARWIAENPPACGNGWEPYPLSLRIVNWIKWHLSGNALDAVAIHSLAVQARHLALRLEWHLLGNHLFANAKALVFAGAFFEGEEAGGWLETGLRILAEQVHEQILPDGGHFELSPMYHCIILEDLLDLVNLGRVYGGGAAAGPDDSGDSVSPATGSGTGLPASAGRGPLARQGAAWVEAAQSMRAWLKTMCHPDGGIALFNDAAFGIAPEPRALEDYARRLGLGGSPGPRGTVVALRDSGYVRVVRGPAVALLDVGRIGPDYLPGHAHADSLGFELSIHGQRLIVDSGTSCYGTGAERHRQRATAAHNTVQIDGADSSEVWGGFRVARRAYPAGLQIGERDEAIRVSCAHDGYRRLPGRPVHRRTWTLREGELQVRDDIEGGFGSATGRLHFHPDIEVRLSASGQDGKIMLPGGVALGFTLTGAAGRLVPSTWHPEFGSSVANVCLEYTFSDRNAKLLLFWR